MRASITLAEAGRGDELTVYFIKLGNINLDFYLCSIQRKLHSAISKFSHIMTHIPKTPQLCSIMGISYYYHKIYCGQNLMEEKAIGFYMDIKWEY